MVINANMTADEHEVKAREAFNDSYNKTDGPEDVTHHLLEANFHATMAASRRLAEYAEVKPRRINEFRIDGRPGPIHPMVGAV